MINSSRSTDRRDRTIKPRDDRGFKAPLSRPGAKSKTVEPVTAMVRGSRSLTKTEPVEKLNSLESCERMMARGFQDVARALATIRDDRHYEDAGYATFDDYCDDRLGWTRKRADQMANAHFTVKSLPTICRKLIANEGQARALSTAKKSARPAVLKRIVEAGESVTAIAIKEEIRPEELKPRERKKKAAPVVIDVEPEPMKASAVIVNGEQGSDFIRGAVWACARLVEMYGQPTMAVAILKESGASKADLKLCTEYDLAFLRKESPMIPKGVE